jgi:UDP-N-acetylglucosamine enolpyruvyl transferase
MNAVLPLLTAVLLNSSPITRRNVPHVLAVTGDLDLMAQNEFCVPLQANSGCRGGPWIPRKGS